MNREFKEILKVVLDEPVYQEIVTNYESKKELSVFELGIDSLDYLSLLIEVETLLNITADEFSGMSTLKDFEGLFENVYS